MEFDPHHALQAACFEYGTERAARLGLFSKKLRPFQAKLKPFFSFFKFWHDRSMGTVPDWVLDMCVTNWERFFFSVCAANAFASTSLASCYVSCVLNTLSKRANSANGSKTSFYFYRLKQNETLVILNNGDSLEFLYKMNLFIN